MAKMTILTAINSDGKKAIKDVHTTEAGILAEDVQSFIKCGFNKIILDIGYPVYCAKCGVIITVSLIKNEIQICEVCA